MCIKKKKSKILSHIWNKKMTVFQQLWQLDSILRSPCKLYWRSQHHPKCLDIQCATPIAKVFSILAEETHWRYILITIIRLSRPLNNFPICSEQLNCTYQALWYNQPVFSSRNSSANHLWTKKYKNYTPDKCLIKSIYTG